MGRTHTVQRGETIVQIARKNGFRAWQPIWLHEQNAGLRSQRPNAYVLAKGDQLFIPDKKLKDYNCQTDLKHVFRVRGMNQVIRQVILDENEKPLSGKAYQLTAAGKVVKGQTDGAGMLTEEVPIGTKTAELKVWLKSGDEGSCIQWTLQLGHLEPVETTYGLKSHLINLGYDCGPASDDFDTKTKAALVQFQREHGLPATGQNDAATQEKLRSLHDYPVEGS